MPARIVLPRSIAALSSGGSRNWGEDGSPPRPLDLEGEFRSVADRAAAGTLDSDTLDAIACASCEAVDSADAANAEDTIRPLVEDAALVEGLTDEVVKAMLEAIAAEVDGDSDRCTLPESLPSSAQPLLKPLRRRGANGREASSTGALADVAEKEAAAETIHLGSEVAKNDLSISANGGGRACSNASAVDGASEGARSEAERVVATRIDYGSASSVDSDVEDAVAKDDDNMDAAAEVAEEPVEEEEEEAHEQETVMRKRYRTRGQLTSERAARYLRERGEDLQAERERQAVHDRELADYYARKSRTDADGEVGTLDGDADRARGSDSSDDEEVLEIARRDRESTQRRLRAFGEPATFFGESDAMRSARLRRLVLCREHDEELAVGSTNVMQLIERRAARGVVAEQRDEEDYAAFHMSPNEAVAAVTDISAAADSAASCQLAVSKSSRRGGSSDNRSGTSKSSGLGIAGAVVAAVAPTTTASVDEEAIEEAKEMAEEDAKAEKMDEDAKTLALWLRTTLRDWENSLTQRGKLEGETSSVKAEKAHFRQSKQYLRPLRKLLQTDQVDEDIVTAMASIATSCQHGKYREAKETYMRLAIGNAPWPMGITMVTFHDRANRHKIGEGTIAHVLNDETTRKYVQMVKRLISFCERDRPSGPALA
eukprot:TRINITY_DN67229_c0_g1_i1.p1 TRINITY_DN67229_c0_g1~~TRINITY_DN67229_c0_g1_i1.p1  ORF type:complete len:658 (-),score=145.55 TRINITY_DN67229_c0_g1_i1:37-2010(-)